MQFVEKFNAFVANVGNALGQAHENVTATDPIYQTVIKYFDLGVNYLVLIIEIVGIAVLMHAVVSAIIGLFKKQDLVRLKLAEGIALSLEFRLVASCYVPLLFEIGKNWVCLAQSFCCVQPSHSSFNGKFASKSATKNSKPLPKKTTSTKPKPTTRQRTKSSRTFNPKPCSFARLFLLPLQTEIPKYLFIFSSCLRISKHNILCFVCHQICNVFLWRRQWQMVKFGKVARPQMGFLLCLPRKKWQSGKSLVNLPWED